MWLHVPSTFFRSAPEEAGSTSASCSPSPEPGLWLSSNGKPLRRPSSWRGWKTRPFVRLLSGTTLPRSTANRGVASWIASLQASRVSLGPSQAGVAASPMSAGSGPRSFGSFARWDRRSCSWRTSRGSSERGSGEFSGTWPPWGSMRSGACWPRTRWERLIDDGESSFWPTPTLSGGGLSPMVVAAKGTTSAGAKMHVSLASAAECWPTPDASVSLGWNRSPSPGAAVRPQLAALARDWPTPTVRGNDNVSGAGRSGDGLATRGRRVQATSTGGAPCSPARRSSRPRLNPLFVEWLMGWPLNWSNPYGAIGSLSSGMGSFLSRRRSPGGSS